jgi:hypothetical protein
LFLGRIAVGGGRARRPHSDVHRSALTTHNAGAARSTAFERSQD